jgi:hypothetical protein
MAQLDALQRFPYVEECNLCTVCIPEHVVAHHPKARAILQSKGTHIIQSADPDVIVETVKGTAAASRAAAAGATAAASKAARRKLLVSQQGSAVGMQGSSSLQGDQGREVGQGTDAKLVSVSSVSDIRQPSVSDPATSTGRTVRGESTSSISRSISNAALTSTLGWQSQPVGGQEAQGKSVTAEGLALGKPESAHEGHWQRQLLGADDDSDEPDAEATRDEVESDGVYRIHGKAIDISDIAPGVREDDARVCSVGRMSAVLKTDCRCC